MRKLYVFLFLLFIVLSCKEERTSAGKNYLTDVVGKKQGNTFIVTNAQAIKAAWLTTAGTAEDDFHNFRIIKGVSIGDVQQEYYLLLAKSKDDDATTAAMLELKGNEFYFEKPGEISSYIKVTCTGSCDDGCLPEVKVYDGVKYLLCSACNDCKKIETEMH